MHSIADIVRTLFVSHPAIGIAALALPWAPMLFLRPRARHL
jgi:hypothetical protein